MNLMKAILLLLLTCLPLWAATTYPMLSDTTNRTVTGEAGKNIRWGVNVTASEVAQ